jgi:hypothetical protein
MKKKTTKLALAISERTEEEKKLWREYIDQWDKLEESWKISRLDLRKRVRTVRAELESCNRQMLGVPFDILSDETPACLGWNKRKYHVELIEEFDPIVHGMFEAINDFAKQHGCHKTLDFQAKLFELKSQCASTGFKLGVLAGALFSGVPEHLIDRFEKGLEVSMSTPAGIVKD